jgi:uncharacterized protein (TIRG00374 family)
MNNTAKTETPGFLKKYWKGLIKTVLVAGLLYILAKKGFISISATSRAFTQLDTLVPAVVILLLTTLIAVSRWHILLRAQDFHLSWLKTLQLTLIGNFFNIALPGAVSGDFVKAFYLGKEMEGKRGRAFGSILFDRVAGVSALVLVSAGALLANIKAFKGSALLAGVHFLVVIAAVSVIAFYGYLFLMREKHDPLLWLFKRIETRVPKAGSLTRIYEGIRHYHNHRWVVLKVLALSVAVHAIVCSCCVLFAYALGERAIPVLPVYVIVPLGLLVTAVPVLPAGVGTGHAAFGWLFHFLGSQRGADIFSLFALSQFLGGGIGGLVYLRFKSKSPKVPELIQ